MRNPFKSGNIIIVEYEAGDYNAQCELWNRATTQILEIRSDQWWMAIFRRIMYRLRKIGIAWWAI